LNNLNYSGFQNKKQVLAVLSGKIPVWARQLVKTTILRRPNNLNTSVRSVGQRLKKKNKPVSQRKFDRLFHGFSSMDLSGLSILNFKKV